MEGDDLVIVQGSRTCLLEQPGHQALPEVLASVYGDGERLGILAENVMRTANVLEPPPTLLK